MRDPVLPAELFRPDRILGRELLYAPAGGSLHSGAHPLMVDIPFPPGFAGADDFFVRAKNLGSQPIHCGLRLDGPGGEARITGGREVCAPGVCVELFFPGESFGRIDQTDGVSQGRQAFRLCFRRPKDAGWTDELRVRVLEVLAARRAVPPGPRLSDAGLEHVLAPGTMRLEGFRNWGSFRSTMGAVSVPPPCVHFFPMDTPTKILAGTVMGLRTGFPPDWRSGPGGLEWHHFLHRQHFLRSLARGLDRRRTTPTALMEIMRNWIRSCPVPVGSDGGAGPAWETLSAAWRLREWLFAAARLWSRPECDLDFRRLWLRSMWEHARHLMDHRGHPGNWRLLEAASLTLAGLLLPEFNEAEHWAAIGLTRLEHEFSAQFPDEGLHCEGSPLYHALCAQACLEVCETARAVGVHLPAQVERRLPTVFEALGALARPDFSWPSINDSGGARSDYGALLRWAGRVFGRADLLWTGTRGKRGRPPVQRSRMFRVAGVTVLRTGFSPEDHCLLFRSSPSHGSHAHEDTLSLEFSAFGQPVVVDPGIAGYAPDASTKRARSARAHSMPLVDDRKPEAELPAEAQRLAGLEGVVGSARGGYVTGDVRVERHVVLLEKGTVVVRDRFLGTGEHDVRALWQLMAGLRAEVLANGKEVAVLLPNGRQTQVEAFTIEGAIRLELQRSAVSLAGRDVPALALTWQIRSLLPVTVISLLSPRAPGLPSPERWRDRVTEWCECCELCELRASGSAK